MSVPKTALSVPKTALSALSTALSVPKTALSAPKTALSALRTALNALDTALSALKGLGKKVTPVCLTLAMLSGCSENAIEQRDYPRAIKREHTATQFGVPRQDEYAWMADAAYRSELIAHGEAQLEFTQQFLEPTRALQERLAGEFNRRLASETKSAVFSDGDTAYWSENRIGEEYPVFFRETDQGVSVLLDLNKEAAGHDYFHLGNFNLNGTQDLLLFTRDVNGDERYEVAVKHLATGETIPTGISKAAPSAYWDPDDGDAFYYLVVDDVLSLVRFDARTNERRVLYSEEDPSWHLRLFVTDGLVYLVRERAGVNGIWFVEGGAMRQVTDSAAGHLTRVIKQGDDLFLLSNRESASFGVYKATMEDVQDGETWLELYSVKRGRIEDFEVIPDRIVVLERERMKYQMTMLSRDGEISSVKFPDTDDQVALRSSGGEGVLRFASSSLIKPELVFEYDLASRELSTDSKPSVNVRAYSSKRIWFTAEEKSRLGNGTVKVPITIAYQRNGADLDERPLIVTAYGAYGQNAPLDFAAHRLSLLDRGFIYAVIHVRGGGELGGDWHREALRENKHVSVADFMDGVRYLIDEGYGAPGSIVAKGTSAGGTLVANAVQSSPELFAAAVLNQPFVDLLNTLSDPSAELTPGDRLEWGDPTTKSGFVSVRSLSPYENVAPQVYPAMLIKASLNDSRVAIHEPLKWAARLRDNQLGGAPVLIDIDMNSGHRGASDPYQRHLSLAREYAFILDAVAPKQ